jgi:hypothetical protein
MTVTDPAVRLAHLSTDDLVSLHDRLDTSTVGDPAMVEAHHLAAHEMLKRGLDHGHEDDQWSRAVIVVDEAYVDSVDDIEFPGDLTEPLAKALAHGGSVQVLLTVDGYVLKGEPGVNAVHVDSIMGAKRPRAMLKRIVERDGKYVVMGEESDREFGTYATREEAQARLDQIERFAKAKQWEVDDFVSWGSSGGRARGRIERIVTEGSVNIPDSSFTLNASEEDPAVLIRVYRLTSRGFRPTDTVVGHRASALRSIGAMEKADSYEVPDGVRSAARRATEWISDGKAGDGFTSVGRNRAKQLADGGSVGRDTLVKMRAYFARHGKQRGGHAALDDGEPTPWRVAWDAWGGDPGRTWVNQVLGPVEKRAIPEAITDIHVNLDNRQHAIDEYLYGPMNPDAPGDYWERLGAVWGVDAEEAKTTTCGNCAAFNKKPEILDAIAEGISDEGDAVTDAADLGYCELFEFKCASARSCSAWLTGGPLVKATEDDIDEEELLQTMDDDDLSEFGSYAYLGDDYEDEVEKAGNPEALRDYWRGGGKGKISWGAGGDFTACVAAVGKYMTSEQAKGYCAIRHREVTGMWPGDKRNRTKKAYDPVESAATFTLPGGATYTYTIPATYWNKPVEKHGSHDQSSHAPRKGGGTPSLVADQAPNSSRSPQAAAEATALRKRAEALEPEITGKVTSMVEGRGGTMEGLEQRLKTTDSLARKIDADAEAEYGGDRAAAAANISDAVRYTAVIGDAQYTDGARAIVRDLEQDGYEVRAKNFWQKGDDYQGINIKATKDGVTVELQLHTPTSLDIKEGRSTKGDPIRSLHDSYEVMRTSSSKRERWKAWTGMVRLAGQIPQPQNYDALLSIGTLALKTFE